MDVVLLSGALMLSVVFALIASRIFLGGVFALMSGAPLPFVFHWKRVVFASALFWFWYLTPVVAASEAATRLLRLFSSR